MVYKLAHFNGANALSERQQLLEELTRVDIGYFLLESNVSDDSRDAQAPVAGDYENTDQDAALLRMRLQEFLPSDADEPKNRIAPTGIGLAHFLGQRALAIQMQLYGIRNPLQVADQMSKKASEYLAGRSPQYMLFLRGFRSEKRWFLENCIQMFSPWVPAITPEPAVLSLEGALQRVLGTMFQCYAVGGRQDILGMGRYVMPEPGNTGEWKQMFEFELVRCAFIMLVPEESTGLNWELEQILSRGLSHRLVLIMLPAAIDVKFAGAWSSIARLFEAHGLALPDYAAEGGFAARSADGTFNRFLEFAGLFDGRLTHEMEERFSNLAGTDRQHSTD